MAVVSTRHRGRHHKEVIVSSKHGRHSHAVVAHAPKATRYAYPISIFMLHPPDFEHDQLPGDVSSKIARAFDQGRADEYAARSLVRAGIVSYHPLHGGIFWRREPVKYIIVHSTETGIPMGATRVIDSWGSAGRRHAGAQYVVDRDGTIYQACDPDLATVHVNVFKTLPGINNDNSIGIEMCHAGHQDYPYELRQSVTKLVAYLQERYKVADGNVITHRYAQQGDHTDPVNFDFDQFLAEKDRFRHQALAYRVDRIKQDATSWKSAPVDVPSTVDEAVTSTVESQQGVLPFTQHDAPVRSTPAILVAPTEHKIDSGARPTLRGPIEMEPGFVEKINKPTSKPSIEQQSTSDDAQNQNDTSAPLKSAPSTVAPGAILPAAQPVPAQLVPVQPVPPHLVPVLPASPQATPAPEPSSNAVHKSSRDMQFFVQPPASVP